jgi:UDP-galactopyranose mutase
LPWLRTLGTRVPTRGMSMASVKPVRVNLRALSDEFDRDRETLICFSHLRWDFVFQRPQHLMSRFAKMMRVFFVEEPLVGQEEPRFELKQSQHGVVVVTPVLPEDISAADAERLQRILLDRFISDQGIKQPWLWYYTPMSLAFSDHIEAGPVIYDCMDELTQFKNAPPEMSERERHLFKRADVVFTGGHSLYEAKRAFHPSVHAFPSSVDIVHFGKAKLSPPDPADQAAISQPRLGFFGVIDERMDLSLILEVADSRPDWHIILIGPVVKIDPVTLPKRANIHYLGPKSYSELPTYLAHWDVALMPFALNEATRFISPTKTPEYLAAGKQVVSTPILDVVRDYAGLQAVRIAGDGEAFIAAIEAALIATKKPELWTSQIDKQLAGSSWDQTHARMAALIRENPKHANGDIAPNIRRSPKTHRGIAETGFDYLIVGAGFAGSVLAERLAADAGKRVLLIDRRPHIGGNAYDAYNNEGILVHRYGPHIFHTNAPRIAEYLSRFTEWRRYEHRVQAFVREQLVPIPINLTTVNTLYGLSLDSAAMQHFLASRAEPMERVETSEDVVVSTVGRELYELFFRGYSRKQWGMDPSALDKCVTARIPTRTNTDDRYFQDSFQCMPKHGYTRLFENMLDHPNIKIMLNTDFGEVAGMIVYDHLIYSGPIDEYFDFRFGNLPYRSLQFRHETVDREWVQPVAVVNYPAEDVPYTRVAEYKHLTGQKHSKTSLSYEFPQSEGDPYYPIPTAENAELYKRYQALAAAEPNVHFVGRLGTYKYYNMDQVIGQALTLYGKLSGRREQKPAASVIREFANIAG